MFLTPPELEALTERHRPAYQRRQLEHMGIPFRTRTDGTLVVLRVHVEHLQDTRPKNREPRLRLA